MLTDYHVHLRPDEDDTPPDRYFTQENVDRYLAAAVDAGIQELGVSEHIHRFTDALSIWDHPFWQELATDDLAAYVEFLHGVGLRAGIEMDFVAGREAQIENVLDTHEFDYVVGSVHFVRSDAVDHEIYDIWEHVANPDAVWNAYFDAVAEAARSGLFDILAHPDLVKIWGSARPAPERDARHYYEPLVEAVAETGVAVEVSTAGLRKPVGELYPAPALAAMLVEAGASFSLSSDAHVPEHLGWEYGPTVEAMRSWGIEEIAVFEGRERRMEPLG